MNGWGAVTALHAWQEGRCAACGRRDSDLVIDHDHQTGLIRGLLDRGCNTMEGMNPHGEPWATYRRMPPAAVIGVREVYWSPVTGYAEPAPPSPTEGELFTDNPSGQIGL